MSTQTTEKSHSESQAIAQLESIKEMITALDTSDDDARDDAMQTIQEDPLSIEVRSGWTAPGAEMEPAEFCILLCTGGPAVRIIGELGEHNEPERAHIEHQDWGTPWTRLPISGDDEDALLAYARQFYFES